MIWWPQKIQSLGTFGECCQLFLSASSLEMRDSSKRCLTHLFFFSVGQLLTTSELLNLQFVDSVFLWCFIPWKRCCDWPMAWNSRGDQKSHLTSKVWRVLLAMSPLAPLMAAAPAGSRFSSGFTQLVNELRQAGPKRLMVITDFDQTLLGQKGEHLLLLGYT